MAPLLKADDPALSWSARHELFGEAGDPMSLWELPPVRSALCRQRADGSWRNPGGREEIRSQRDYDLLASYEALLPLVYQYRLDSRHPAIAAAADFLLGFQSEEGDLRGIYGSQYSPNYTAAILATLIDAGYLSDPRVELGIRWLLSIRQNDGGWTVPWRTRAPAEARSYKVAMRLPKPLAPDHSKPFSHLITGIVLRALAAHPAYRTGPEARLGATLLASRFFKPDAYPDRRAAVYWEKLRYPFRWTDIVSALDAITQVGIGREDQQVQAALQWLAQHQRPDGLWRSPYEKARDPHIHHWVSFAIARLFRRLEPA